MPSRSMPGSAGKLRRQQRAQALTTPRREQQTRRRRRATASSTLSVSICRTSAAARRAEREADRDLLLPARRPREQQRGDVGAGDQQHEADRAEQHEQRGPHVADQRSRSGRRLRRVVRVRLRELPAQPRADRVRVSARACSSDTPALEPADRPRANAARGSSVRSLIVQRKRHDDVGRATATRIARGSTPTMSYGLPFERDRPADDGRIGAEAAAPQRRRSAGRRGGGRRSPPRRESRGRAPA